MYHKCARPACARCSRCTAAHWRFLAPVPGERFETIDKGGEILLELRPRRPKRRAALSAGVVLATAIVLAFMAGASWHVTMWLFALMLAPIGAALAAVALALWFPAYLIQIREGAVRAVRARVGIAFGRVPWKRRPELSGSFFRRLVADAPGEQANPRPLSDAELAWIEKAAALSERRRPRSELAAGETVS